MKLSVNLRKDNIILFL